MLDLGMFIQNSVKAPSNTSTCIQGRDGGKTKYSRYPESNPHDLVLEATTRGPMASWHLATSGNLAAGTSRQPRRVWLIFGKHSILGLCTSEMETSDSMADVFTTEMSQRSWFTSSHWRTKKKAQRFTFRLARSSPHCMRFLNLNFSLLTLKPASECQNETSSSQNF